MWKPPPVPMDVYGAVSKLKNVDVLQNVQKAKGIWAEAFELGGEKSEVEAALAEWNENLHDLADLDDQEAAALMPAGGREAAAAAAAPMIDSSYLTMASISPLDGKPPQQRRGSMPGAVESRLGMGDGDSPPASPVHAPAPAPESVSLLVSDSYHGSTAAEEATEAVLAAERELDLVTKMGAEEHLQSDEQASVYDKIIHMQREKLKQLQREKARAESEAQQAHAAATTAQRRHISEANRRPNANGMPLSSPEEILAAGKGVAAVVIPVMRTRRGMAGLGLFFAVLFLYYVTQKGVDSRDVEVAGDSAKGHATERLVEKAELEQLVVALLQDQKALVNGAEKKDSETMERHIDTVSKLLMKMHQDHMRSQDKVHDKLSRENDKLMGELERLNAQVKGALEQPTSLGASPPPPAPGAAPLPPPEAPPAAAATPPPAPGGAPPPAAAAEPPPAPGAAPPPPVAA